jgi:hypothetical protein
MHAERASGDRALHDPVMARIVAGDRACGSVFEASAGLCLRVERHPHKAERERGDEHEFRLG